MHLEIDNQALDGIHSQTNEYFVGESGQIQQMLS
jgi:hypothetical protein